MPTNLEHVKPTITDGKFTEQLNTLQGADYSLYTIWLTMWTSHSKTMGINNKLFPLCCDNSLHLSGNAFHWILAYGYGDLPWEHKSLDAATGVNSAFQLILKVSSGVQVRDLFRTLEYF